MDAIIIVGYSVIDGTKLYAAYHAKYAHRLPAVCNCKIRLSYDCPNTGGPALKNYGQTPSQ